MFWPKCVPQSVGACEARRVSQLNLRLKSANRLGPPRTSSASRRLWLRDVAFVVDLFLPFSCSSTSANVNYFNFPPCAFLLYLISSRIQSRWPPSCSAPFTENITCLISICYLLEVDVHRLSCSLPHSPSRLRALTRILLRGSHSAPRRLDRR